MGTVGLSFGSPTGGTGFDVKSTVAEIVTNLQKVETPWKTQITSLQSQDTVLSKMGTMLSSLSNDMSSLTDFSGVLAQKAGSSSNTGVLELMSASNSAVAGTYEVSVSSLASTANGYLASIASSSDKLTGSIVINGTTINVPATTGKNTLAGLASAINAASIGVTASVTADANGSRLSLVSNTSGVKGTLSVTSSITDSTTSASLGYTSNLATGANASITVNGVNYSVASNSVSGIIPGVTFQLLGTTSSGSQVNVVIANDNSGIESVVNQFVTDYNSLISAINTQEGYDSSGAAEPLFGSPTLSLLQQELFNGLNMENPDGYLAAVSSSSAVTLSGSMTIQVGSGSTYTFNVGSGTSSGTTYYTGNGANSLADLASAINSANIGATASIHTANGESMLVLTSQTSGSSGALTVSSAIAAAGPTPLTWSDASYTSTTADSGAVGTVASATDALSGALTLRVGTGTAQTFDLSSLTDQTLTGLATAINGAKMGVTASVVSNSDGTSSLSLVSGTTGSAGALSVSSTLFDTTNTSSSALAYTTSSDVGSLTALGISMANNGTLSFNSDALESVLNSDFSSVVGFFQNAGSWGQSFSTMLSNSGTTASTGILKLAQTANSTVESALNAQISKEEMYISAQQSSLTKELTSANEILQSLPTALDSMDMLYSAITGYNKKS